MFPISKEDKMKAQMEKFILKQKKKIYTSLTETVKENMTKCYIGKLTHLHLLWM